MIAINYGDYKFADFAQNVQNSTPTFMYGEEWLNQLLKISDGTINNNLLEKITFADDRLIEAAYKIMLLVDLKKVTLMEWAILKRYFDALYDGDKGTRDKIREYLSAYIGSEFSDAEISKEMASKMIDTRNLIESESIDMPNFFFSEAEETKPSDIVIEQGEDTAVEYDDDVLAEWENLKEVCEMALADRETSKSDVKMYLKLMLTVELFV